MAACQETRLCRAKGLDGDSEEAFGDNWPGGRNKVVALENAKGQVQLTFPMDLIPLTKRAHTIQQDRKTDMPRLKDGCPPSSILSEAFKVCRYQKYV